MLTSILRSSLIASLLAVGCSDTSDFRLVDAASSADLPVAADVGTTTDAPTATDAGRDAGYDVPVSLDVPVDAVDVRDAAAIDAGVDAGQAADAPADAGEQTCIGRPSSCASGTAGGACGDALTPPDCVAGSWRCPDGTIPVTECSCVGRPPRGCTCGSAGWLCPDGGL